MKKILLYSLIVLVVVFGINFYKTSFGQKATYSPNQQVKNGNSVVGSKTERISIAAKNLEIPWEMVFLPDNSILTTERSGNLKLISNNEVLAAIKIPEVKIYGEGGLLGLALHPKFSANGLIYIYYTFAGKNNETLNRVVRYKYQNGELSNKSIIIDNIPGAIFHNGGRLKFGPDGFLYVTTGDSLNPSLAQNKNSLAGKILRITDRGSAAPGNPFNNLVYSYGHRNPQGLAWDASGKLWETEHGNNAHDEVNIIIKGHNYGWPTITGQEKASGMETPLAESGADTWAPAGAAIIDDSLYFGGLRGQALLELKINKNVAEITRHLDKEFGRIRDVVFGPDNLLYITTSNRDGRGTVNSEDDKIIRVDPHQL